MMGKTHMAIGFLSGAAVFSFFEINPVVFIALATFGALLPDVDHENSKINRLIPVTRWIPKFFSHRGFFHSIFPPLFLYFGFWFLDLSVIGIPLTIGYLSHLASDCLTRMGCNLIYPISQFRIQGFVYTNGISEFVILLVVLTLNALFIATAVGF